MYISGEGINSMVERLKSFFSVGAEYADERKHMKRILLITSPAFVELLLTSLVSVAAMAFVGRIDSNAITGVGITNQPLFLFIAVFQSINVGTTALVSWSVGEGNPKRAGYVLSQTIIFNFGIGMLLSIIGYFTTPALMRFMSSSESIVAYATEFMQITCFSLVFVGVTMGISAALRGMGETRIPMIYNLFSNIINVILNYILVFGKLGFPELGVAGSATAILIARAASCCFALFVVLAWKKSPLKVDFSGGIKLDLNIIRQFINIGLPAAGEQFVIQTGLMLFSKLVVSLGEIQGAAHQIISNINSLAFSVSQAFSISNTALVGQAVGANDYDMAERNTRLSRKAARITSLVIAAVLIAFSKQLASFYTNEIEVINLASPLFIFIAAIQFSQSSQMCFSGALRGAGDTMYPLIATFAGIWGVRLLLAYIFIVILNWGLIGAWLAFFLDQTVRNLIVMMRFKSGKWRYAREKRLSKTQRAN